MKFRNVDGQQVPCHKAMHCLFRPVELEQKCLCQLWRDVEFKPVSQAKDIEHFHFQKEHPLWDKEVATCRTHPSIPVFAWNWLPHTGNFKKSIAHPTVPGDPDHHETEEHCKRFVILFLPFRKQEELVVEGNCQKTLMKALENEMVDEDMRDVANNIQDIHNSLQSELVNDPLVCKTIVEEGEASEEVEDPDEFNCQELMESIGECFASTSQGTPLDNDATSLNPTFVSNDCESGTKAFPEVDISQITLENVMQHAGETNKQTKKTKGNALGRFLTNTSQLNTLAMSAIVPRNTDISETAPTVLPKTTRPKATGTWESVIAWGEMAMLDDEQQTAFQILVATFVLTFCEEAKWIPDQDADNYIHQMKCLRKLARKPEDNEGPPLRMFITGPAGAGKCKLQFCSRKQFLMLQSVLVASAQQITQWCNSPLLTKLPQQRN